MERIPGDDVKYTSPDSPPLKEILFAVVLLVLGTLAIVLGIVTAIARIGGDRAHGFYFASLGVVLFIPGFYYTRIAYYAFRGYEGFSYESIPPI